MLIALLLTVYQFQGTFSSQASPPWRPPSYYYQDQVTLEIFRHPDKWPQDQATMQKWKNWYDKWNESQKELMEKDKQMVEEGWTDYDHDDKPRRWTRLPPGRGAQEPPVWAVIPNSYGKPDFCIQPPAYGECVESVYRWAFNPYAGSCQQFRYSGCGGNSNNFLNSWRCEEACLKLASSLCLQYGNRRDGVPLQGRPGCN